MDIAASSGCVAAVKLPEQLLQVSFGLSESPRLYALRLIAQKYQSQQCFQNGIHQLDRNGTASLIAALRTAREEKILPTIQRRGPISVDDIRDIVGVNRSSTVLPERLRRTA